MTQKMPQRCDKKYFLNEKRYLISEQQIIHVKNRITSTTVFDSFYKGKNKK